MNDYVIEMLNITKEFPGIIANDDITLQLKRGEIHALLGENGAGKSTLMSVLFGLYQAEKGVIKKDGEVVKINNPNDANELKIGMVHQHFKLVENFTVLENIILGVEPNVFGFLKKSEARRKIVDLSEKYGLKVDPDGIIEEITVGMQQRVEILKMLYRDNEILIFDEPTAVLTPQEIDELMNIMKNFANEGKSILFITHKLNEIMAVADRCTVLRKGKLVGTVDIDNTSKEELSKMMVGREVNFNVEKGEFSPEGIVLSVNNIFVASETNKKYSLKDVSFDVHRGEIVCIAGIDGNGQSELVYALTGMEKLAPIGTIIKEKRIRSKEKEDFKNSFRNSLLGIGNWFKSKAAIFRLKVRFRAQKFASIFHKNNEFDKNAEIKGRITLCDVDITKATIRHRSKLGMSHIPEDRQKFGLVLDYSLEENLVLQQYWKPQFQHAGFIKKSAVRKYSKKMIEQYDIRSGQGSVTKARSMSGGNQQKAILAREIDKNPELLVAVQPTRGLDVGAIEYIHDQLVAQRDSGKAVLLVSLELDEVMDLSDRILVMYEGEIVAELDPKIATIEELGLYMAGAKRQAKYTKAEEV
ncbi:MAG: ABC transporter ATP-binding protein [Clostridia bacterium]|nr:ABC transporter ATP-binding protein [Clostridia bacterium]